MAPEKPYAPLATHPLPPIFWVFIGKLGWEGGVTAERISWESYSTERIGVFLQTEPNTIPTPNLSRAITFIRNTGTEYCLDPEGERAAMSAAERTKVADDIAHTLDTINWTDDGDTIESYAFCDPGSELVEVLGVPSIHGRDFCLICYRTILNRAKDLHFTNERRLVF